MSKGRIIISVSASLLVVVLATSGQTSRSGSGSRQSVVGSPHDLSVAGPGPIHAIDEERVCIFCHTPHRASGQTPLWNRHSPPTHYRIYESSTTDARIDQPSGPSKKCLSCHDGALALGLLASRPPNDPVPMSHRRIPPGPTDLTKDLSDDHPIGFRYDRALSNRDAQIKDPALISRELPLGHRNEMHCTTCHDPHDNNLGNFLRLPDQRSALCLACHDMLGWGLGSHSISNAAVTGRAVDPRERLAYHTVADNACSNCHKSHSAGGRERLLRFKYEEDNCLNCHNGSVARTNIAGEMSKRSTHPVERYVGRHDPAEDPRTMRRHVECVDCHNPHASQARIIDRQGQRLPETVNAAIRFVPGVSRNGQPVEKIRFEYELCFKCHADGLHVSSSVQVPREITQVNTRLEFQTSNPSYHPVIGPRNNRDVVSLLSPWRVGSVMACTDCHNSDQAGTARAGQRFGPHGSIHEPLLVENYSTRDFTTESERAYALCYRCHDRQSILNDESFPLHSEHIVRGRASCAACHDPHGVSRVQGNSRNHSNLINFDRSVVQQAGSSLGRRIEYQDLGPYQGSCTLTCHGVVHVRQQYGR
jgi:predicted CXXCH cytochrome family protein